MVEFSNTFKQLNAINLECTMPKRQAVVIFPEVNYELSFVMENVKGESWRRSTSSPKIGILVLIMHLQSWKANLTDLVI
jgi:hypothetical protein